MSKSSMIIETSERCICLNEACANQEIPRSNTTMRIDTITGVQTVRALCPNCLTLYIARRKPNDGVWGPPTIEVISDGDKVAAFHKTITSIGEIQRDKLPPVRVASCV